MVNLKQTQKLEFVMDTEKLESILSRNLNHIVFAAPIEMNSTFKYLVKRIIDECRVECDPVLRDVVLVEQ